MIQIFGTKKCSETRKTRRFFEERRIPFHFIELSEKPMSRGELESVCRVLDPESLLDTEGKLYRKQNLQYMKFDIFEKLLEEPLLFRTPIVRNGKMATVGYVPERWKEWI